MNREERRELMRRVAEANTPLVDRIRARVYRWVLIALALLAVYLLVQAYATGGPTP